MNEASNKKMGVQKVLFQHNDMFGSKYIILSSRNIGFKSGMTGISISNSKISVSGKFFIGFYDFLNFLQAKIYLQNV